MNAPSLPRLEQHIAQRQHEAACAELLAILYRLDMNFGGLEGIAFDFPPQLLNHEQARLVYFCTRTADAITRLFTDPDLQISPTGLQRFMVVQRWLALIFASSPYVNADHILQTYNQNTDPDANPLDIHLNHSPESVAKFCILYLPESVVNVNLDILWELNPVACASLALALQSPRFLGTPYAFNKRGNLLQWLPEKLAAFENLDNLPTPILHDAYMHCSYDASPNKHQIKQAINQLIRRHLQQSHWQDREIQHIQASHEKPVMVVLLEHFNAAHSIYRTHSTSLVAAREVFYVVGVGSAAVDATGRAVFDEFHELPSNGHLMDKLTFLKQICRDFQAAVLYMPSIGMDLLTIFASNTRLAPIQAIALGHPATTHSPYIDYVLVEEDYVGKKACFSEKLLYLPKDALPYVPSALAPTQVNYVLREQPEVVQIGVAATTMKLNPYFLEACRAIRDRASVKVHFHFALGQSHGISHPYVERFIQTYLGKDATAHPHLPYEAYLNVLNQCDMMLNPFPFGNTNGIIDMMTLGLVGVCKTGDEVHEHIDEGLFKRLRLPEWLITRSADEYVACALRLVENHSERLALRRRVITHQALQTLFTGDARPLGLILRQKVDEFIFRLPEKNASKKTSRRHHQRKKKR